MCERATSIALSLSAWISAKIWQDLRLSLATLPIRCRVSVSVFPRLHHGDDGQFVRRLTPGQRCIQGWVTPGSYQVARGTNLCGCRRHRSKFGERKEREREREGEQRCDAMMISPRILAFAGDAASRSEILNLWQRPAFDLFVRWLGRQLSACTRLILWQRSRKIWL